MDKVIMNKLKSESWKRGISYQSYTKMISELVTNKATSGSDQSESLVVYTKLNYSRMKRLNKTLTSDQELINVISALPYSMKWLVITEAWCGDAAQNIPFIAKTAAACKNVELRFVMRDENPELMDKYLTNGSRSIPKLIVMDSDMEDKAVWGPRPTDVQAIVSEYSRRPEPKIPFMEFAEEVHKWYTGNKNNALRNELIATFQKLEN